MITPNIKIVDNMLTKNSLIELYKIEKSGVLLNSTESHYLENKIVSFGIRKSYFKNKNEFLKMSESQKLKIGSHDSSNIIEIIKSLNSDEIEQIENDFFRNMLLTNNVNFFNNFYIKFFNPNTEQINKFLSYYFNKILDNLVYASSNYKEIFEDLSPIFSIVKNNFNEKDKKSFISYCINRLLTIIDNGFLNDFLYPDLIEMYFNTLGILIQFANGKNENVIEKEKELLKPIILAKIYSSKENEESIFNGILKNRNFYSGDVKDIIFSILIDIPEFRKRYIKLQLK